MGYGTDADRIRLAALSKVLNKSGSELIIAFVRSTYKEIYGDQDPEEVATQLGIKLS